MMSTTKPESHLLSIVEVSHANRIRCQADGCGHLVFKRIHVVLDNGKFHVLGSRCFAKLYCGLGTAVPPYYGGGDARPLTDDERALLVENTALFIEQLERERIENERAAAVLEAERQQNERIAAALEAERQQNERIAAALEAEQEQTEREMIASLQKDTTRIYDVDPAFTSSKYRYIWSSSWWKSSGALLENVRAVLRRSMHVDVIYRAIVEAVRQPTITPIEFAFRLKAAGVPSDVTLQCLYDLKLVVRGKTV
ncbi:hypothetical protein JAB6_21740 [Janthinobacterium sp. HH104]|uniref:hypothetical protein n=1 Tax=Janthinobacterium sp. HH104 TaxID=1537276 RepID=UPI0008936C33|nr:hypothetical protein [Janthinobacterium sp. HH104]OEZ85325.1 hypothetical protein JAB6_21740 [Janthinobacterium sp. HH104]